MTAWLGLDIGGANLKAARPSGEAEGRRFALWKRPDDLASEIESLVARFPTADALAVTMTAELCDCFGTKAEGVRAVLAAIRGAANGRRVLVWGIDRDFHEIRAVEDRPLVAAASNWLALATMAAGLVPGGEGLVIDVGSTTTDLIPIRGGRVISLGLDDPGRLRSGTLVYAGVRRTPICALATSLIWRGSPIGLAAELFATTLDVFLTLGSIPEDPLDLDTADGRPATIPDARGRLARMVGADRDGFGGGDAFELASAAGLSLLDRLIAAAVRVIAASGIEPRAAIVAGSGEFLARSVAERVVGSGGALISLAESIGPPASVAACAVAVARLAEARG